MSDKVNAIPEGYHTLTPHLVTKDAGGAIAFYEKAFGAKEQYRMPCPMTGKIMHARLKFGDSVLNLAEEFPEYGSLGPISIGGSPVVLHLYVEDVDALFEQAVEAGATVTMPPMDMFWGDRYGKLVDPFGHHWSLATRIEEPNPAEMQEKMMAMMSSSCAE